MNRPDPIAAAASRAAEYGSPPATWNIGPEARFHLDNDSTGHLLDGATITHWTVD